MSQPCRETLYTDQTEKSVKNYADEQKSGPRLQKSNYV